MAKLDIDRLKVQIKLALTRLQTHLQRHQNTSLSRRREISDLLLAGHTDRATVRTKHLIRDDYVCEAWEIVQTALEDLLRSLGMLRETKLLDDDLAAVVRTIAYAAARMDIPELRTVRDTFNDNYPQHNFKNLASTEDIDPRLVIKLAIRNPELDLVIKYMTAIAQSFNVLWLPAPEAPLDDQHHSTEPPPPYPTATAPPSEPHIESFEELQRRFQALKQNK